MQKSLIILAVSLFITSARADDFTVTQRQNKQAQPSKTVLEQPRGQGAVQWALGLRNPAQAINPAAPPEYGNGSSFVDVYEEYDPSQHTPVDKPQGHGVKLFSFSF